MTEDKSDKDLREKHDLGWVLIFNYQVTKLPNLSRRAVDYQIFSEARPVRATNEVKILVIARMKCTL